MPYVHAFTTCPPNLSKASSHSLGVRGWGAIRKEIEMKTKLTNVAGALGARLTLLCATFGGCLDYLPVRAADMPVTVSGWNRDVIVERTAVRPYTAAALPFDVPNEYAFYEVGLPAGRRGLPPGRMFTSLVDGNTVFQFQPYDQNNVLQLSASTSSKGILTLGDAGRLFLDIGFGRVGQ
jgi:hypothetical protein